MNFLIINLLLSFYVKLSSTNQNAVTRSRVNILVLAPYNDSYLFSRNKMQPAIEYALTSLQRNKPSLLSDVEFTVTYKNSSCDYAAGVKAVEFYYENSYIDDVTQQRAMTSPMLFLGPVCNVPTAVVSTFASEWNVPVISPGSQAAWVKMAGDYPTLTQITPSYVDVAYFIKRVLSRDEKKSVYLIYEDAFESKSTERECHNLMQSVYAVFQEHKMLDFIGPYLVHASSDHQELIQDLQDPQVVLMCASSDVVRSLMIAAYRAKVATRGRNAWYVVDLHNDSHYADGAWKRGDYLDKVAKVAYRALEVFTLKVSNTTKFRKFSKYLGSEYRKRGVPAEERKVNGYAENFHDAVLLYAHAINRTLSKGKTLFDSQDITNNMKDVTIQGIAGPVSLDVYGFRHGEYSLLYMANVKTGKFQRTVDLFGKQMTPSVDALNFRTSLNRLLREHANFTDEDLMQIGLLDLENKYLGEKPNKDKVRESGMYKVITAALGTLAGIVMCCILIVAPICYRQKCSRSRNGSVPYLSNNNNQHEAAHLPLREEGSVATCMTALDEEMRC